VPPEREYQLASRALVRIALICICSAIGGICAAAEPVYSPAAVKSAFLHRFASYVEWPEAAASAEMFTVGVYGGDDVAEQLERLLPELKIQNRRAQLRRVAAPEDLAGVHVLYIGQGGPQSRAIISAAARLPILTVTDGAGGLESGSVINFVQVGRNIRFEVSLRAAERSQLRIASGLLSVAMRVEDRPRADTGPPPIFYVRTVRRARSPTGEGSDIALGIVPVSLVCTQVSA
jgi:hypothetical protein